MEAKFRKNKIGDRWIDVPNTGNYPLLLLEVLSGLDTNGLDSINQRAYDEEAYGISKYTQVIFTHDFYSDEHIIDLVKYLNSNA